MRGGCCCALSRGERAAQNIPRKEWVRVYGLSRELFPLTPTLSATRAFTPVFDGLWGRGSSLAALRGLLFEAPHGPHHCIVIPASRITLPQRGISLLIQSANSAGVLATGSKPIEASFSFT